MIIDSHLHVMSPDQKRYPRRASVSDWVRDMSAEMLLDEMRVAGIDHILAVQALGAYLYDNSYAADVAVQFPERFTGVAIVDVLAPDAPEQVSYWVKQRGVRGLRIYNAIDPVGAWIDSPATYPVWEQAQSLGITVNVLARFSQLPRVRNMLERFPNIPVALDHMAHPPLDEGPPFAGSQPLFDLAAYPNAYLKFSPVNQYEAARAPGSPREFYERLVKGFGASRLIWGSNYPATHDRPLKDLLKMGLEAFAFLREDQRRLIYGDNAARLWLPAGKLR